MIVSPHTAPAPTLPKPRRRHKQTKENLRPTANPSWIEGLIAREQPAWERVTKGPAFTTTAAAATEGEFPAAMWRTIVLEFWCVVEAFPKYMGLTLAKTTFGKSPRDYLAREWLIGNIAIESMHAAWYIDWARAHDVSEEQLVAHRPAPETAALHEWLFSVAHRGSLPQAIGAINYAIEGTTGMWCKDVYAAFQRYYGDHPERERSLAWLKAHAVYDDLHPIEALEIVKLAAHPHEYAEVESSVVRSLELFAAALDACHARHA
jgi:pyrroloquinoline quinone (PQQ) biosynthesis protein C